MTEDKTKNNSSKLFSQARPHFQNPLAFGAAAISGEGGGYGFGSISEEDALNLLSYAYDQGLRIFDAAPIYGYGIAEKRLGTAFSKRREKVFLISKSGVAWHDSGRVNMTNDPKITEKMLVQSLRDLRSEYIDLYFIHWPDPKVDIRRPMEVLAEAQYQGKIKYIGLSNTHLTDLKLASEVAHIDVVQSEFNFFNTSVQKLFPYFSEKQISFMGWGTFDKGVLTGTVTAERKFDPVDARSWAPWWKSQRRDEKYQIVEVLRSVLEPKGFSLLDFALQFGRRFAQLDVQLCGMKSRDQIDSALRALRTDIPDSLYLEIDSILIEKKLKMVDSERIGSN